MDARVKRLERIVKEQAKFIRNLQKQLQECLKQLKVTVEKDQVQTDKTRVSLKRRRRSKERGGIKKRRIGCKICCKRHKGKCWYSNTQGKVEAKASPPKCDRCRNRHRGECRYKVMRCKKCKMTGHSARVCRKNTICHICGQRGHKSPQCFNKKLKGIQEDQDNPETGYQLLQMEQQLDTGERSRNDTLKRIMNDLRSPTGILYNRVEKSQPILEDDEDIIDLGLD